MRFICAPAIDASCLPTAAEPVNEIFRTAGALMRCVETSDGTPQTTLRHPAGKPASWNIRAIATTALGESSGPLSTSVQPAPKAATTLRNDRLKGKFQGVNAAQTPMGSRETVCCTPGVRA